MTVNTELNLIDNMYIFIHVENWAGLFSTNAIQWIGVSLFRAN